MVGSAGNAPVRHFRLCFLTPDLQSGSRITSLGNWYREWESHPPEEVYEASLCILGVFPAVEIRGPGGYAPAGAWLQGKSITCRHDPKEGAESGKRFGPCHFNR